MPIYILSPATDSNMEKWQMVRIYQNQYPSKLYLGICSQAPQAEECTSTFKVLSLTTDNVDDFRMGE